ncbi:MAG: type II secretion system GspH family protein [Planctomycetes bacterium]|nr:type II secretion system GspH family protein [Planctomycetota bacterium]
MNSTSFFRINKIFSASSSHGGSSEGFTLVELLVVIAILGIIISLVLVGVGRATQTGRTIECMKNLGTIGTAVNTYSSSNNGRLPSPRTDTPVGWSNLKTVPNGSIIREDAGNEYIGWVRTDPAVPGTINGSAETSAALQKGSLYDYIGSETAYKSPQDPTGRLRSYSLNSFVGVMYCEDTYPLPGNISTPSYSFDTRAAARILKPAETLLALPEWDQAKGVPGWNVNGFIGNPEITIDPVTGAYANTAWYNVPAVWNSGAFNMVLVDGHTVLYQSQSPEMINGDLQAQFSNGAYPDLPDTDVDLYNIKKMLLPGKIN